MHQYRESNDSNSWTHCPAAKHTLVDFPSDPPAKYRDSLGWFRNLLEFKQPKEG